MSKEEFMSLYGDVGMKFYSYYKNSFQFMGHKDNQKIMAGFSGSSGDTYTTEIKADEIIKLCSLDLDWAIVYDKNGKEVCSFREEAW